MRKYIELIISLLILTNSLFGNVFALEINPASGNYLINSTSTFTLIARPPGEVDILSLRLNVIGGTVQSVNIFDEFDASGSCTGGLSFITDNICIDVSSKMVGYFVPPLEDGAEIGEITILWNSNPTTGRLIKLDGDNGNIYIDTVNNNTYPDSGTAGTYTISSTLVTVSPTNTPRQTSIISSISLNPSTDNLPVTSVLDNLAYVQGLLLIIIGGLIASYINLSRNE